MRSIFSGSNATYDRHHWNLLLGGFAGFLLGNLTHGIAPVIVEVLIAGLGIEESAAGLVVSAEFIGIALTAIFIGPYVARLSKRRIAIVGCLVAIGAHLLSTLITHFEVLLMVRLVAGFGTGSALAAAGAAVASANKADRMFAFIKTGAAAGMAAIVVAGGYSVRWFGVSGAFSLLALLFILILPLLRLLPETPREEGQGNDKTMLPMFGSGCTTIGALLLWLISAGACWVFVLRLGQASGYTIEQASSILGLGLFIGLTGGLLAAWLDTRVGRQLPLAVGILAIGVTWWVICVKPEPVLYAVCVVLNNIAYFFVLPYILGTAAALDRFGRWAAIASTSFLAAMAVAPVLGGILVEFGTYKLLGWFTLVSQIVSLALFLAVLRNLANISHSDAVPVGIIDK